MSESTLPWMKPCAHAEPQGASQLHGVCIFCYRDRLSEAHRTISDIHAMPLLQVGVERIDGKDYSKCLCGWLAPHGSTRCGNAAHQGNVQRAWEDRIEKAERERDDYARLVEVWRKRSDSKTDRIAELEAACIALRDDLEETVTYAPGYFQEKWELGASLKLPTVAALPASAPPPAEPETCKWCDLPPADGDSICVGHQASHAAHSSLPLSGAKLTPAQEANGRRDIAFEDAAESEAVNSSNRAAVGDGELLCTGCGKVPCACGTCDWCGVVGEHDKRACGLPKEKE